jgi:hypothetical protein
MLILLYIDVDRNTTSKLPELGLEVGATVLLAIEARPGGLQILPQPIQFAPALYQRVT